MNNDLLTNELLQIKLLIVNISLEQPERINFQFNSERSRYYLIEVYN